MLFSVFYVGDSCQGWGREFESRFPLQIQKALVERLGLFLLLILLYFLKALLLSLFDSIKNGGITNGLDPYTYLSNVLKRLPTHKVTQIEELLPHRWKSDQN